MICLCNHSVMLYLLRRLEVIPFSGGRHSSLAYLVEVVRVERGLEGDNGEDEGREHGGHVQELQLLLTLTAEQTIHQSP